MSIMIDIDFWADISGVVGKNVSDVSRRVSCVSNVCQLWGNLPTDIKSTCSAKVNPRSLGESKLYKYIILSVENITYIVSN
jgi:hypothetical protein